MKFQVGDLVYRAYSPVQCGKIVADLGRQRRSTLSGGIYESSFHHYRVKWLKDGSESDDVPEQALRDFAELVAEHRRKYENHAATLERLRRL